MVDVTEVELGNVEWKGYVKRALEGIDKKLVSVDSKLDLLDTCVNGMKIKVAAIGAVVSLVVTILVLIVRSAIAK